MALAYRCAPVSPPQHVYLEPTSAAILASAQAKYGAGFRSMDYINVRHVAATIPNQRLNATSGSYERDIDVTGGGAQSE